MMYIQRFPDNHTFYER